MSNNINNTGILSFRKHKNVEGWLDLASREMVGRRAGLLRMIFVRAAIEQNSAGGFLGRLFGSGNSRQTDIGNTKVFSVRLSKDDIALIKNAAAAKHMNISEWTSNAIEVWFQSFDPFYEKRERDPSWLTRYTQLYLEKFREIQEVYARKQAEQSPKTPLGQGL